MAEVFGKLAARLVSGRPLLLAGDVGASLRARGTSFGGPGALGRIVREHRHAVEAHYAMEVEAGVDVLTTLTSDTTPRALAQVGMAFRSAAITAAAVDLALEAAAHAPRAIAVAGVLGGSPVAPVDVATLVEEHAAHAARLAASGVDFVLARGMASRTELMAAVVAAANTELPTWAVVEAEERGSVLGGESPSELVRFLETAGATVVLFEAATVAIAEDVVDRAVRGGATLPLGVLLDAGASCIDGYPDGGASPDAWAEAASSLLSLPIRAFGGGRATTYEHTAALGRALRRAVPSIAPPTESAGVEPHTAR